MKNAFVVLGATYTAYSTAKEVVLAVTHPLTWIRDKVKSLMVDVAVNVVLDILKDEHKKLMLDKVSNHQRTVDFSIPVPSMPQRVFAEDSRCLTVLHELVNDALAAPLALLGYQAGKLNLAWDGTENSVKAELLIGLIETTKA